MDEQSKIDQRPQCGRLSQSLINGGRVGGHIYLRQGAQSSAILCGKRGKLLIENDGVPAAISRQLSGVLHPIAATRLVGEI
jgi:hypothetical protein